MSILRHGIHTAPSVLQGSEEEEGERVTRPAEPSLRSTTTGYEAQFLSFLENSPAGGAGSSRGGGVSSRGVGWAGPRGQQQQPGEDEQDLEDPTRNNPPEGAKTQSPQLAAAVSLQAAASQLPLSQQQQQQQQPPPPAATEAKARLCCRHCTYSHNSRAVMREHIYNHTSVVPYSCGYCGAIFGTKSGVMSHNKREHKNASPMVLKTKEINEEDFYYEQTPVASAKSSKRKAESPTPHAPAAKRKPTARKTIMRAHAQGSSDGNSSVVASLLQAPPITSRERETPSPASSGSLKMKFSISADKKEAILMSGPGEENRKSVNKVLLSVTKQIWFHWEFSVGVIILPTPPNMPFCAQISCVAGMYRGSVK